MNTFKFNSLSSNLQSQQCTPTWNDHNKVLDVINGLQQQITELQNNNRRSDNGLTQLYQRINRMEFMQKIAIKNSDAFDLDHFRNFLYNEFQKEKLPIANFALNYSWIRQIRYW
jgi:hypothetical protein